MISQLKNHPDKNFVEIVSSTPGEQILRTLFTACGWEVREPQKKHGHKKANRRHR